MNLIDLSASSALRCLIVLSLPLSRCLIMSVNEVVRRAKRLRTRGQFGMMPGNAIVPAMAMNPMMNAVMSLNNWALAPAPTGGRGDEPSEEEQEHVGAVPKALLGQPVLLKLLKLHCKTCSRPGYLCIKLLMSVAEMIHESTGAPLLYGSCPRLGLKRFGVL